MNVQNCSFFLFLCFSARLTFVMKSCVGGSTRMRSRKKWDQYYWNITHNIRFQLLLRLGSDKKSQPERLHKVMNLPFCHSRSFLPSLRLFICENRMMYRMFCGQNEFWILTSLSTSWLQNYCFFIHRTGRERGPEWMMFIKVMRGWIEVTFKLE